MINRKHPTIARGLALAFVAVLAGCHGGILDPKGQVAADEKSLIITATVLMMLVVVPVIVMTLAFAWKYRASNTNATYTPKWAHSHKIEAIVWLVPCVIIVFLAILAWKTTHRLDPYRPLDSDKKPVTIEAVSLNWKWVFIYPDLHIATVNQIAFPVDVPVNFKITSGSVMNSFFIPQLGGQIYAMTGMMTRLHLIANEAGSYDGLSSNYSGAGFSGMHFKAIATRTPAEFDAWVKQVREKSSRTLDAAAFDALSKPSENHPVEYFSSVTPDLFTTILNRYMSNHMVMRAPGKPGQLADLKSGTCTPVAKE
ncbi:ubiquinol oxidase subunit II [Paludibacterium yongneupense]|uniref:ubiquinol oxidase subunit II n=1 Tax=Paludibacterium yongneupense TaxID=400061 RepID=UPI0004253FB4|nr:ubiquinol oxidase subunit II [Paludibacterium yongneupense]